jgi:hypothetical protein
MVEAQHLPQNLESEKIPPMMVCRRLRHGVPLSGGKPFFARGLFGFLKTTLSLHVPPPNGGIQFPDAT